jgi:hypothetical protein
VDDLNVLVGVHENSYSRQLANIFNALLKMSLTIKCWEIDDGGRTKVRSHAQDRCHAANHQTVQ